MTDQFAISDHFLNAATILDPKTAAAAIIVDENDRVLLQLRDDKPEIFFPNHWGCFGGAIEPGEKPYDTLLRELHEELGIAFNNVMEPFITISFNTKAGSKHTVERYFFIIRIKASDIKNMRLNEGLAFDFFDFPGYMRLANATPYDKFALWLYFNQDRLSD